VLVHGDADEVQWPAAQPAEPSPEPEPDPAEEAGDKALPAGDASQGPAQIGGPSAPPNRQS